MMHQSISKYKLYLYLLFFIFLSTTFNFKFVENFQDKFRLNQVNITGLPNNEKTIIEIELDNFQDINIFKLKEDKLLESLNKFNFLENISVKKIIPSSININLSKTSILGKTLLNGEKFYIGENGKFIKSNQLFEKDNVASVFGNFKIDEYLNLIQTLEDHKLDTKNIKKYYYYKNKRWDLLFSSNLTLMLPSKDIKKSIKIYKKLLDNGNLINIKTVDLRIFNQIILTNYNE